MRIYAIPHMNVSREVSESVDSASGLTGHTNIRIVYVSSQSSYARRCSRISLSQTRKLSPSSVQYGIRKCCDSRCTSTHDLLYLPHSPDEPLGATCRNGERAQFDTLYSGSQVYAQASDPHDPIDPDSNPLPREYRIVDSPKELGSAVLHITSIVIYSCSNVESSW